MTVIKWSALSTELNIAGTALDNKATGTTTFIADIDNSTDKDLYMELIMDLGSVAPASGNNVRLFLRRKRGSVYAENASEEISLYTTSSGTRALMFHALMRIPNSGVYGLWWTNNLNITTNASGNALIRSDWNEEG